MRRLTISLPQPERSGHLAPVELVVDPVPTYVLLPDAIVADSGITAVDVRAGDGDRLIYRLAEVRMRVGDGDFSTLLLAGPSAGPPSLQVVMLAKRTGLPSTIQGDVSEVVVDAPSDCRRPAPTFT